MNPFRFSPRKFAKKPGKKAAAFLDQLYRPATKELIDQARARLFEPDSDFTPREPEDE